MGAKPGTIENSKLFRRHCVILRRDLHIGMSLVYADMLDDAHIGNHAPTCLLAFVGVYPVEAIERVAALVLDEEHAHE